MNHGVEWDMTKEARTTTVEPLLKENAPLVLEFPTCPFGGLTMVFVAAHRGTKSYKVLVSRRPAFWVGNVESLAGKCPSGDVHQTSDMECPWSVHGVSHEPEQHRPSRSDTLEAMCLSQSKSTSIRKVKFFKELPSPQ